MFECSCGKTYKYASGLTNHKEKCGGGSAAVAGGGGGGGGGVASSESQDPNDITKSPFFTIPLTSFQPTANFTKEDLEMLEKRKQARLKAILQSQKEQADKDKEKEKKIAADAAAAAAAAASVASKVKSHVPTKNGGSGSGGGGGAASGGKVAGKGGGGSAATATASSSSSSTVTNGAVVTNNKSNVGNEEHNASFNINYVRRSEETQQIVRAVTATAHQFCKGRIIVTSDEPAPPGAGINGVSTTVNADGTTVHNHPTRTISIIEAPPEEVSPEEEHDITLEKMTYLILSLIQNNNKLTKENNVLRQIVDQLDPTYFG
jgi:hypothetical protein